MHFTYGWNRWSNSQRRRSNVVAQVGFNAPDNSADLSAGNITASGFEPGVGGSNWNVFGRDFMRGKIARPVVSVEAEGHIIP